MPKGEQLRKGQFTIDFETNDHDKSVEMVIRQDNLEISHPASAVEELDGLIQHAKNHLKKYYHKHTDGRWYDKQEARIRVGSIVLCSGCFITIKRGRYYTISEVLDYSDTMKAQKFRVMGSNGVWYFNSDFQLVQY